MSNNENANFNPSASNRRSSVSASTLGGLFGRSGSIAAGTPSFPGPITTAVGHDQRRRISISTLGLSGTSPTQAAPFNYSGRRGSVSTDRSASIDENAIEDDDNSPDRSAPSTPFTRRMSFGAQALLSRPNGSPGTGESGFNWSEQLRSRAESSVSQSQRPNFSTGPNAMKPAQMHERKQSMEMQAPPTQVSTAASARPIRPKPDAFQERILKGDFYMD